MSQTPLSFCIIGGGFSGSLLAVHLLRRLPGGARVHLIEKRNEFGSGVAYSTLNESHLLNVRAERMSAFAQDPTHFKRWLAAHNGGGAFDGASFVPRSLYGRYVQSLLTEQLSAEGGNRNLYLFPDEATGLDLGPDGVTVQMRGGRPVKADAAILAIGNFPPQVPAGAETLANSPRYIANPWDARATGAIHPDATVLVIGTGLTMVDFVLNMLDRGHRGALFAISRRGLLPHPHAPSQPEMPLGDPDAALALSERLRRVRSAARAYDWRSVIDGLRPHTPRLWQQLSQPERERFLRHMRPWWDIHRHRMAPKVASRIDDAIQQGALTLLSGRFVAFDDGQDSVTVKYRLRGRDAIGCVEAGAVVNCSGPCSDYGRIDAPLVRSLLDRGAITPDGLGLGLDVSDELRLLDRAGRPQARLYGLGPVTRSRFWECTAVPEIRLQAEMLAERLIADWG